MLDTDLRPLVLVALLALAPGSGDAVPQEPLAVQPPLSTETFDEQRALVLPSDEELAWMVIGWRASLWEGVIEAQASEKPILLWAMNGHPLGCT